MTKLGAFRLGYLTEVSRSYQRRMFDEFFQSAHLLNDQNRR